MQLASQLEICWDVTDRIDAICEQVMRATVDTETQRGPNFWLTVDPSTQEACFTTQRWFALRAVSGRWSVASTYPPSWTTIPADQMYVDDISGYLGGLAGGGSGAGSNRIYLAPGIIDGYAGRSGYRVQVTYINGFPNSGITPSGTRPNGPNAGDTTIHVDDVCGWDAVPAGLAGRVYDPTAGLTEGVLVTAFTPDTPGALFGPGVLTLGAPLAYAHGLGVRISTMPSTFRRAALNLATMVARLRGATAIRAQTAGGSSAPAAKSNEDLEVQAELWLAPYKRIL